MSVKPARPGWYEGRFDDDSGVCVYWFDGAVWKYAPDEDESLFGNSSPGWEHDHWRDLAETSV